MTAESRSIVLASDAITVVLTHHAGMPEIVSIGPSLPEVALAAFERPVPRATLDEPVPTGLVPEHAVGYAGRPGLVGARPDGTGWSPRFRLDGAEATSSRAVLSLVDPVAELGLTLTLELDAALVVRATLRNFGDTPYGLIRLSPTIPLPAHASELITFEGRWCREFQPRRSALEGLTVVENRRGRTSHHRLPALFAGERGFGEHRGEVWGLQLAWSGNFELSAEHFPDGQRVVQLGELLSPGEVTIEPGGTYTTPDVVVVWSECGLTPASQRFHAEVRRRLPTSPSAPRPVILNTWEAVYFDHRFDVLAALADRAAAVGVERFVLDDGWFGGRRDDSAGLGDWWVSEQVWPGGLGPIVDHVVGLGMDFGLWVEPEMVNPDSDLYRDHPEWTLTTAGYEPPLARRQLVLDLGRPEVRDHLFEAIGALLDEYPIAYLKWDMNRDVVQGSHLGHAGTHGHVLGLYSLVDRLRAAHPDVEIESCSSGGARADLGILRRTDRIWTSDCNDAVERQLIQRGFSMLFPPEVMGAHIGPDRAHTTGRRHDLGFRVATAMFGHLGIEWNLLEATPEQLAAVRAAVASHRRLREVLHGGQVVRVDHPDDAALVHGVVAPDRSRALFAYVQLSASAAMAPVPFRLAGLDPGARYRVEVLDVDATADAGARVPGWLSTGVTASGAQLERRGLQPPVLHPECGLLVELTRV